MTKNIKALLATTALFFSTQALANNGCAFDEKQEGFIATCSEEKQEVILTGEVQAQTLVTELEDFVQGYAEYQVDTKAIEPLKQLQTPTEIVVIIGTWCPDCHRETPRFIRIIEALNNPNIKVSYIGVDRKKQDPEGLAAKYDFTRIPTFIVKQDGKEIGRIVERPEISLEVDLAKILK
ncbi:MULTISPECIES: thioredoxin family protein [Shewanella]|uniref:Thiol reductase thioredoxin n=1 Tax=Shewanella marisflavi TaxID=260364 RepID=A0AAC9TWS2_9GAMM|nr:MULTISPECIES: thioredoxin family protein [Shewanella]ASJ95398.1 thiol reductase thioredoxin [Shewanella marisflavi]MCL1042765.1 thiol reductase thioredoxin [Shewanella marisflavi]QDF73966.1 thiol reductase thioredoxin [Shewanella marisflavi]